MELNLVLSSQNELVDNVKINDQLDNSDHNQIHFDIKVKQKVQIKNIGDFPQSNGKYKYMKQILSIARLE